MSLHRRQFITASTAAGVCLCHGAQAADGFAAPGEFKARYYGQFSELPVGAIKASGWIKGWLDRQVAGLTGHPENLGYPYNTQMLAGKIPPPSIPHGEAWWPYEQAGYFIDGAARLNFVTRNAAAAKIPDTNLAYILTHSGPGKFGESTHGWPNAIIGRALMADYGATGNPAAVKTIRTCLGDGPLGRSRDEFLFEQTLYLYGLTGDVGLLNQAKEAYDRYFINDPKSFSHEAKIRGPAPFREHGVTAAEQLKLLPLTYAYTGDTKALELAKLAYNKVVADSLMPDGGVVSSENLGTAAFNSLHETCDITDWSWSFGYMLMASGEGKWGDLIERATFNALPGAVTKDFKQLQYFSSANQILCSNTACSRIAMTRMSYRAAHDTECCSGNVNRAMPNYVSRMWMRTKAGLALMLYGPSELETQVNGRAVRVVQETDYPFRDTIRLKMALRQATSFELQLRIPEWCSAPTISLNGQPQAVTAKAGGFTSLNRRFKDGDIIELRLPMTVALEDWFATKAVCLRRGPLVYSLKIAEKRTESLKDTDALKPVLKGNDIAAFPAVEFFPTSEWRFGADQELKAALDKISVTEAPMPDNPFEGETVPVQLEVPLRPLSGWANSWVPVATPAPVSLKDAPKNPTELPDATQLQSAGPEQRLVMVPYGSTHLRLTTLPVIPSS